MSSLCYFNSGDTFWKKTSQLKSRTKILDDREDVEGVASWWGRSSIKKTRELITRKCYEDLQLLPMSISGWKNLSIGKTRVTTRAGLPIFTDWPVMTCAGTSFNLSHHQLIWSASADNNWCTWICKSLYPPQLNRQQPKFSLHLQVLV